MIRASLTAIAVAAFAIAAPASAATIEFSPAVVFDMGGKFDKSFTEAAYQGAERFKNETGIAYREFEVTQEAQRDQGLRNMARRGANMIIAIGFARSRPSSIARRRNSSGCAGGITDSSPRRESPHHKCPVNRGNLRSPSTDPPSDTPLSTGTAPS